jgi:hypothetical protein
MRDRYTPLAGSVTVTNTVKYWLSDRTGTDRYITSPIPGSTSWTLSLSWTSKAAGAFTITFYAYTSQGKTLQTQIVTGTINLPSDTGPGTTTATVNQPSDVTPAQTPYDAKTKQT